MGMKIRREGNVEMVVFMDDSVESDGKEMGVSGVEQVRCERDV